MYIKLGDSFSQKEFKNGELHYKGVPIARYGVFEYLGKELGVSGNSNKLFKVLHPKEELFNQKTIDSLTDIPVYLGHVSADRGEKHSVGFLKEVYYKEDGNSDDKLYGNIVIFDKKAIERIEKTGLKGLSLGFYSDVREAPRDADYDFVLRNINGQDFGHLAIVEEGRVGKDIKLLDEKPNQIGGIMVLEEIKKFLKEKGEGKFSDEDIEKITFTTSEEIKDEEKEEIKDEEKEEIKDEEKEEIKKEDVKEGKEEIKDECEIKDIGNENSGNYNHKGRPGEIGGSSKTEDSKQNIIDSKQLLDSNEFVDALLSKLKEREKIKNSKAEIEKLIGCKVIGDSYDTIKKYKEAFEAGRKAGEATKVINQNFKNEDNENNTYIFKNLALKLAGEE